MFATSPLFDNWHVVGNLTAATFRGPVVYFGGSFSRIFEDWAPWLEKFEGLLRRMFWEHAYVILETGLFGHFLYRWEAEDKDFSAENPVPIQTWTFEGGPRSF